MPASNEDIQMKTFRRFPRPLAILFAGSLLGFVGCAKPNEGAAKPPRKVVQAIQVIDRRTFTVHLPADWTEDVKDDRHDPDAFVFFENAESCLFTVIISKKSGGASVEELLTNQKEGWQAKLPGAKSKESSRWGNYEGRGFEMEGNLDGLGTSRVLVFGFENSDYVCTISESATPGDFEEFADDFQKIRQTFRLK